MQAITRRLSPLANVLFMTGLASVSCDGTAVGHTPTTTPPVGDQAEPESLARRHRAAPPRVVVYASERELLRQYELDLATGALTAQSSVTFPLQVHYAVADDRARTLYVSTSNGSTSHQLFAYAIDESSGALTPRGAPLVPSGGRIINLSFDKGDGGVGFLALAHNQTLSAATVALAADGSLAAEVAQVTPAATGFFPHQAKFDRKGRAVIVPGLGAGATATAAEQPGTISVFGFAGGQLTRTQFLTLGPGLGARHLDFHQRLPVAYVAIERGNRLYTYGYRRGQLTARPLYDTTTLDAPGNERPRQRAGAIHVHPNGRFVYVSNRADATVPQTVGDAPPVPVFAGGENSIAVFRIDQKSGEPKLLQLAPTLGFEARTFTIDPTGNYLIVGNQSTRDVRKEDNAVVNVPRSLVVFRICGDGRLEQRHKYDVTTNTDVFWVGSYQL